MRVASKPQIDRSQSIKPPLLSRETPPLPHIAGSYITYVRVMLFFPVFIFLLMSAQTLCSFLCPQMAVWDNKIELEVLVIIVQSPLLTLTEKPRDSRLHIAPTFLFSPLPLRMINQTSYREMCIQIPTSATIHKKKKPVVLTYHCLTGWWGNETT